MSPRIRRRLADESGFTLVELLVVIVIIGILAAIGIPAFLNQRTKAQDSEAKVYATTAVKALEVWHTDHQTYAGADLGGLVGIEPSLGRAGALSLSNLGTTTFTVSVDSRSGAQGGGTFTISRLASGVVQRTCANAGSGGCAGAADPQGNLW
jgi:type IV pilus assembly protein PilA